MQTLQIQTECLPRQLIHVQEAKRGGTRTGVLVRNVPEHLELARLSPNLVCLKLLFFLDSWYSATQIPPPTNQQQPYWTGGHILLLQEAGLLTALHRRGPASC
ncbi:hypothetical protein GDO81_022879 [Engystomops pustulosus]|uniref:Uncharacterized protein n=1 Tax=Engystomops pustulosus TaxID=76066 RepID=A0AAV6Z410_ENGPU|nr:hypothetical protein GDO81_022879 [Engystomops pustulosus]